MPVMSALERSRHLVDQFKAIPDQEDRYFHIIALGKKEQPLPDDLKIPKYKIDGCASDLWLVPDYRDGKCYFRVDSNAFITKGVASILAQIYSDATPDEVLDLDPAFMREAGIGQLLSPNRANGLASICKQIRLYALVYKSLADRGVPSQSPASPS